MTKLMLNKFIVLTLLGLASLSLSYCSGMSGSPGGVAPGGAVGEAPGGGAITTGGGSEALPVSGPVAAASGGILSAPTDDETMTECAAKEGRWRLRYNVGFPEILNPETSKTNPAPYLLTATKKAFLLVEGSRIADLKGNWSEWYPRMSGYQVRMVLFKKGKPSQYQDTTLPFGLEDKEANAVFSNIPAEIGDILQIYVYLDRQVQFEDSPVGRIKHCIDVPPPGFSVSWAPIDEAKFEAFRQLPSTHALGALRVDGFSQNDDDYKVEIPFSSMYRVKYGNEFSVILNADPKAAPGNLVPAKDKAFSLLLEIDYALDPTKPNDREWMPLVQPGSQVRVLVYPKGSAESALPEIHDLTLDGFVYLKSGMGVSFLPQDRPSAENLAGAYNVSFKDFQPQAGDRLEIYYYAKIDEKNSTVSSMVFSALPAVTDLKSLEDFKADIDTHRLGTLNVTDPASMKVLENRPSLPSFLKKSAP
ncbi:MAG: hypothetical protein K8R69_09710 [Deltaproteobacteria bacterium]|nr:hypothetical protein [Deltaproteobacteria bacterium]